MRPWARRAGRARAAALVVLAALACTATARRPARTTTTSPGDVASPGRPASPRDASLRTVRIALARGADKVRLAADGEWLLVGENEDAVLARPAPGEGWTVEVVDGRLYAMGARVDGAECCITRLTARPDRRDGTIGFNGRRWRGEIVVTLDGRGTMTVVNRLPMDDYLRGVVPLEIGTRAASDFAAAEAQAVAARSYAYMHLAGPERPYDMLATVADQVYGGLGVETLLGNQAVENTAGLVLMYAGRVVNAPYHGNCGGSTAEPGDVWRTGPEPYLQRVSDRIPGTDRYYCEAGPKFRWTRRYTADELRQTVVRYLRSQPRAPESLGRVRGVTVTEVTPAGRVATLTVDMDGGRWALRGNEIRAALRTPSGEMLYSTYFSVDAADSAGEVRSLELRGGGNGHGIGMCQSGAIGRARAGQDFRTILTTYYPGTTIGTID